MKKQHAAELAALIAALQSATDVHRADRKAKQAAGQGHDAALFAAVKAAEQALADWRLVNIPAPKGPRPVFGPAWLQRRVAEQRAEHTDRMRRVAIARAKAGVYD
jgi:hypothetical protein